MQSRILQSRILKQAFLPLLALISLAVGANAHSQTRDKPVSTQTPAAQPQSQAAQPQSPATKSDAPNTQTGAVAAGIDPAALWDGRKLMPFHALDYPRMVAAEFADFLTDDDYVLGITINGQSRAYPTRYVWWHHFINDKTDRPGPEAPDFLISYCSVCNTGIRFDPRVAGKPILFDFYGLYNGVVIMCDRDTESVWLQVEGRAVKGPRLGAQMPTRPLLDTTWGAWRQLHPDTLVMSPDNPYKRYYSDKVEPRGYDRFPMPMFEQTLTRHDTRLPAFDKVLGVTRTTYGPGRSGPAAEPGEQQRINKSVVTRHKAYPLKEVEKAGGVVNDTWDGEKVVVLLQAETQTACAFSAFVDSKGVTLEARRGAEGKTAFYDKETGTRWSIEGVGLEGPLAKKSLTRLDNHLSQWYGWAAYFPDTSIYGRADAPASAAAPPPATP